MQVIIFVLLGLLCLSVIFIFKCLPEIANSIKTLEKWQQHVGSQGIDFQTLNKTLWELKNPPRFKAGDIVKRAEPIYPVAQGVLYHQPKDYSSKYVVNKGYISSYTLTHYQKVFYNMYTIHNCVTNEIMDVSESQLVKSK